MADDGSYTEGVTGDGVVILDDGQPMSISLILDHLNRPRVDPSALSIMLANSDTVCRDLGFDQIDQISKAVVAYLRGGAK